MVTLYGCLSLLFRVASNSVNMYTEMQLWNQACKDFRRTSPGR